ncbi:MAG: beta-ketoacyl-[acyl-carrier-protein] synthase family protein [bacterium]
MRRVVITGIGIVSPVGKNATEHFNSILNGKSGVDEISLFDVSTMPVKIGGEIKNIPFESLYSECPELQSIADRKIFFGYMAFQEAIQDARLFDQIRESGLNLGVSLEVLHMEKLVFPESGINVAEFLARYSNDSQGLQVPLDTLSLLMSRRYKISGPSYVNCSACAASTQTIGHSFRKIQRGDNDIFICGGYDSMMNPIGMGGFSLLGALSTKNELRDKASRPYDRKRDGAILGEGAGVIVLEELHSALKRGAEIYGEIVGYGSSLDAYRSTDPEPSGAGAEQAILSAIADAKITPERIDYINGHGTSTPKNDLVETRAIKKVFGDQAYSIPISSTKSMVGHLIAASGAVEIISSLTGFLFNKLHPTINYEYPDPACDLDYIPNKARAWEGHYILKNSFGFGGQNACLIIKRYES